MSFDNVLANSRILKSFAEFNYATHNLAKWYSINEVFGYCNSQVIPFSVCDDWFRFGESVLLVKIKFDYSY